ncbi:MAG: HAD-IC family P-type ATPase [Oscillospiraceae bacterium]|jgi:cation-transporting ATPase E|nr:HAD-IC family P-type ATPase [Oscillospiraceae bacterium]
MAFRKETGTASASFTAPPGDAGLTSQQVRSRLDAGAYNVQPEGLTPTVGRILFKNTVSLFNLLNVALAILLIVVGHPENTLFMGIVLSNSAMGIIQELRAKRTLDKLAILARGSAAVIRDGVETQTEPGGIVLHDLLRLRAGAQIYADAEVVRSDGLECDESLLTGEPDSIYKNPGDKLLSGSFVTAGGGLARVIAVGRDNYASMLTVEAKKVKNAKSKLMRVLNFIIRCVSFTVIPVGALMFYSKFSSGAQIPDAVLDTASAVVGMIPQGLILLTGVTLTVGALNLARRGAMVQSLFSIETLARADVLCLDKTGTITDGTLSFEEIIPLPGFDAQTAENALGLLMGALDDQNATADALRKRFGADRSKAPDAVIPFSSSRKYSGAQFGGVSFVLGAPAFVFPGGDGAFFEKAGELAQTGKRVLCLARSDSALGEQALPLGLQCAALIVLSDTVRADARETFRYFADEGVTLKVISGDDARTVSNIAGKAGIAGAEDFIDMSACPDGTEFTELVKRYTVFGRVSPAQKRELVLALQKNGHTTCMTGDGVNDILAMKASDCSVAMMAGSDAARGAGDFVLVNSDFSAMINVLKEGRRVINNIETVSCLYLTKTVFSALLSLLFIFLPHPYPYTLLQMTPVNALTVGVPSFFLALRANYYRPEGRFLENVLEKALPAALTVVFNVLFILAASVLFGLSEKESSTINVFLVGVVGFVLLAATARPITKWVRLLLGALCAASAALFIFFGRFFDYGNMFTRNALFYLPLILISSRMFWFLSARTKGIAAWYGRRRKTSGA